MAPAETLETLRRALLVERGPQPLVTYYDLATGERVELSSASMDNWVAKTANLAIDLGAGPGDSVRLALPAHWQGAVWVLATWAAGMACAIEPDDDDDDVAIVVTTEQGGALEVARGAAGEVVVCSLRPLGLPCEQPLAPGMTDYALEVRAHGDRFTGPAPGPLDRATLKRTHAEEIAHGRDRAQDSGLATGSRLLLAGDDSDLAGALALTLVLGGSLVIVRGGAEGLTDIERAEHVDARVA